MPPSYPMPGIPQVPIVPKEIVAPVPNVQNSSIMTAADLKSRFLYGINLTPPNGGPPMSDDAIQYHIDAATSAVENYLQIDIRPRYYAQERADYQRSDYTNWGYMRLKHGPIIQIYEFLVIYPDTGSVVALPLSWLQTDAVGESNVVNIIPGTNSMGNFIIGYGNSILPLVFSTADFLPDLFKISYKAGFPANKVPEQFTSVIGKKAVIDILIQISNSFLVNGAIEQQIGVDGHFERVTTIPFLYEKQIELYRKQYAEEISQLRSRYAGIKMVVA
jgi:hypothetical protein